MLIFKKICKSIVPRIPLSEGLKSVIGIVILVGAILFTYRAYEDSDSTHDLPKGLACLVLAAIHSIPLALIPSVDSW